MFPHVLHFQLPTEAHDWTWFDGSGHPYPILWFPEHQGKSTKWFLAGWALAFSGPAALIGFGWQTRKDDLPAYAPYFAQPDESEKRKVVV